MPAKIPLASIEFMLDSFCRISPLLMCLLRCWIKGNAKRQTLNVTVIIILSKENLKSFDEMSYNINQKHISSKSKWSFYNSTITVTSKNTLLSESCLQITSNFY